VIFVDTHCHLNFQSFGGDISQVIDRALDAGVVRIVVPGLDVRSSEEAVNIASRFESVYAAVGVHPNEVKSFEKGHLSVLEKLLSENKVVAIGEVGLDYYHHPETKNEQLSVLEIMINLSKNNSKPIILHSRTSIVDLLSIIQQSFGSIRAVETFFYGVFHAFEGNLEQAKLLKNLGFALGIGGPITYKNSLVKKEILTNIGLENIVLETDAPFLSPHPFRGLRNEPFRIPIIADKISNLLNISVEAVAQFTTRNAISLFHWGSIN
jgi:TatD DNase family protein